MKKYKKVKSNEALISPEIILKAASHADKEYKKKKLKEYASLSELLSKTDLGC